MAVKYLCGEEALSSLNEGVKKKEESSAVEKEKTEVLNKKVAAEKEVKVEVKEEKKIKEKINKEKAVESRYKDLKLEVESKSSSSFKNVYSPTDKSYRQLY